MSQTKPANRILCPSHFTHPSYSFTPSHTLHVPLSLWFTSANERTEVKEARAGDIVAIVGLKDTVTGDTLCDPEHAVILERMDFPNPVIKIAVEPKTKVHLLTYLLGAFRNTAEGKTIVFSMEWLSLWTDF